ncbi:MAG: hypothetical protein ACON3Z_11675 [Bradymonadia bacterium]
MMILRRLEPLWGYVFGLMAVVSFAGCKSDDAAEGITTTLTIDTRACLGTGNVCRRNITAGTSLGDGFGNACLLMKNEATNSTERRRFGWVQNQLTAVENTPFRFAPGTRVSSALFILESGNDQAACAKLSVDSPCEATICLMKLGSVTNLVPAQGRFLLDFRSDGVCEVAPSTPPHPSLTELCNGLDDDCDGKTDEDYTTLGDRCSAFEGCNAEQSFACSADQMGVVCTPTYAEVCDNIDNDCNGLVDDIAGCTSSQCTTNADCSDSNNPICADGICRQCNDNTECGSDFCDRGRCVPCIVGSNLGCSMELNRICRPTLEGDSTFCSGCENSTECQASQMLPPICDLTTGRCVGCDPNNLLRGCDGEDQGLICDDGVQGGNPCRSCSEGDCGLNQECVQGDDGTSRCQGCDEGSNEPCDPDGFTPICRQGADGALQCRSCSGDNDCAELTTQLSNRDPTAPARPFCAPSGRCVECINSDGCAPGSQTPICNNGFCSRCNIDDECTDDARPYCVPNRQAEPANLRGRCVVCDIDTNDGCRVDNPLARNPICDRETAQCRACVQGDDCGNGRYCVDGLCIACNPQGNLGCSNNLGTPVCDPSLGRCRQCRNNGECDLDAGGLTLNYCVGGACAVCSPNEPGSCPVGEACVRPDGGGALICGPCTNDAQCGPSSVCLGGACRRCSPETNEGCAGATPICTPQFQCVQCTTSADCGGNLCENFQCIGVQCRDSNDCADGQQCNAGECVDVQCVSDQDCNGRLSVCQGNQCVNVQCVSYDDCLVPDQGIGNGGRPFGCIENRCANCGNGPQDDRHCRGYDGEPDRACTEGTCRTCRHNISGSGDYCLNEDLPFCNPAGDLCYGVCNVPSRRAGQAVSIGCTPELPQCHYTGEGNNNPAEYTECKYCFNSQNGVGQIDLGCRDGYPRCLDNGNECCRQNDANDCITD